jgi:hypothetical protein
LRRAVLTALAAGLIKPSAQVTQETRAMVERKAELRRQRARRKKLLKLKTKLAKAKEGRERDQVLQKIRLVSPWWKEPAKK